MLETNRALFEVFRKNTYWARIERIDVWIRLSRYWFRSPQLKLNVCGDFWRHASC